MTRQSAMNWGYVGFAVAYLAFVILVFWSDDAQQGSFRNPDMIRWANRIVAIPSIVAGAYCVFLGTLTLRARKYPPPGVMVPIPSEASAKWNLLSAGLAGILGGVCVAATPFAFAFIVGW